MAVREFIAFDVVAGFKVADGQGFQFRFIDFYVEMTGIGQDDAVFHVLHVFAADDILVAGEGDEDIADLSRFGHGHDFKPVENGFDGFDRVDFGDDDMGTEAFGTHSAALAAPAIAGDDDFLADDGQVRRAHDAVPRGLACAITVIEEVFAVRIVGCDHGELQFAGFVETVETVDASRRFFRAAEEVFHGIGPRRVQEMDLVAAVIDDDVRVMVQGFIEEIEVFFIGCAIPGIDGQTIFDESRCDVVLCGQRITAGHDDVGAGPVKDFSQISRLGFEMDADANRFVFKSLVGFQFVANGIEGRHMTIDPADFFMTAFS